MAIDITKDKLISLEDAAKMFPKPRGGHIHPKTVKNWITAGYQGITLEGAQVGSKFYTTSDALRLFSQQLNERRRPGAHDAGPEFEPLQAPVEEVRDKVAAVSLADEDFGVAADDFTIAGEDTVVGEDLTVEMPCQPLRRTSS